MWEWVGPKAGLLVYGLWLPSEISGANLFGSVTFGKDWSNGYEPLATLDYNKDGKIAGDELKSLWVWVDANTNALPDKGEVRPASDYIIEIPVKYDRDADGNAWQEPSIPLKDGKKARSWDWWSERIRGELDVFGPGAQAAGVRGEGKPLENLSVYYWSSPFVTETLSGLLRFVKVGREVYVISVAPGRLMAYAKVEQDGEEFAWTFRTVFSGGSVDSNHARTDGNYLVGTGEYASPKGRSMNGDYTWTAELVGAEPTAVLPPDLQGLYQYLTSFSDEEFATAISTFPPEGSFAPGQPDQWPGLQPAEISLDNLFSTAQ